MTIAKIDYINLLPFHIFLKSQPGSLIAKSAVRYKKSVPSSINKEFLSRRANLAFISSITAKNAKKTIAGIIAKKAVQSVIVLPGCNSNDNASATSNILAKVLKVQGQVLIGDKALKKTLEIDDYVDLAETWNKRYGLPFVFAIMCYNKDGSVAKKIANRFTNRKIKIPQTVLEDYSKTRQIPKKEILKYLEKISYKIGQKELQGYKKFLKLARKL